MTRRIIVVVVRIPIGLCVGLLASGWLLSLRLRMRFLLGLGLLLMRWWLRLWLRLHMGFLLSLGLLWLRPGLWLMLGWLRLGWFLLGAMLSGDLPLLCRGLSLHPSFAAIVAYPVGSVFNDRLIHVGIVNDGRVYVVHGRIIMEVPALPATAAIAIAAIAIAVINAAIKTNLRSPITLVKYINVIFPCPIRRGPIYLNFRRLDP